MNSYIMPQKKWKSFGLLLTVAVFLSIIDAPAAHSTPLDDALKLFKNIIEPRENQLAKLISEGKTSEAVSFFYQNQDYFQKKKADNKGIAQKEVVDLALAIYENEYRSRVNSLVTQLESASSIDVFSKWQEQNTTLVKANELKKEIAQHTILSFSTNISLQSDLIRLTKLIESTSDLAASNRGVAIETASKSISPENIDSRGVPYIGTSLDERIKPNEFKNSIAAQKEFYSRIEANGDILKRIDLLNKFSALLNEQTIDAISKNLVIQPTNQRIRADGKITIAELKEVMQLYEASPLLKKFELVKIGFIDLTSGTARQRNLFDFEVEFKQDIGVKVTDAKELFLKGDTVDSFDFILAVDLSVAKINREFRNKSEVGSKTQTGTRQRPNEEHINLTNQYQRALAEFQSASIQSASRSGQPCYGGGFACALVGALNAAPQAIARSEVESLGKKLSQTSQFVTDPVYTAYSYQAVDIHSEKTSRVDYYLIDIKERRFFPNFVSAVKKEKFSVVYNVSDNDPDRYTISRNNQTEKDAENWEKQPINISLKDLFLTKEPASSSSQLFSGPSEFLAMVSKGPILAAPPQYTGQKSQSKTESAVATQQVIADSRFESVVVIRTPKGLGSGFFVTPELILTAYHVVDGSNLVEMSSFDGGKNFGKVIDHDVRLDLALVKAQNPGKPVQIFSGPIKLGETVEAIGHPKGYEFTITRGIISALRRAKSASINTANLVEFIQTDTPISPGNSGGPLFLGSAVVGVNDWVRVDKASQNLNFSVSYNEIKSYLDRFKEK